VLGLPVGKHFKLFAPNPKPKVAGQWNGADDPEKDKKEIERKYTPCTSDDEVGYVDLVIKVYKGGVIERFADGGKMSQYLGSLKPLQKIDLEGPMGLIEYYGRGDWKKFGRRKHIGMMAGGTGITPMLQIIKAVLMDDADTTEISVLFANQTEEDILVRDMLDEWDAKYSHKFKVWYTVDRPPAVWKYSSGFITEKMIQDRMPPPSPDSLILMCGPPPMVKFACQANLEKLGYDLKTMSASF